MYGKLGKSFETIEISYFAFALQELPACSPTYLARAIATHYSSDSSVRARQRASGKQEMERWQVGMGLVGAGGVERVWGDCRICILILRFANAQKFRRFGDALE